MFETQRAPAKTEIQRLQRELKREAERPTGLVPPTATAAARAATAAAAEATTASTEAAPAAATSAASAKAASAEAPA